MVGSTELLLSKIKGKDLISYSLLSYLSATNTFGSKEMAMRSRLNARLYNMFLKSLDKECARRLKALDALIKETIQSITEGNNWSVNRHGAEMTDNYQNWGDFEFRTCDTHRIKRDDCGYYVEEGSAPYEIRINQVSNAFLNRHRKQFEDLHRLYFEKESIMCGNYSLSAKQADFDLPRLISSYLGYYREKPVRRTLVS